MVYYQPNGIGIRFTQTQSTPCNKVNVKIQRSSIKNREQRVPFNSFVQVELEKEVHIIIFK